MKKVFYSLLTLLLLSATGLQAQVTIGSQADPHAGAVLDLQKNGDRGGFLLPQVVLTSATVWTPLGGTATEGMMVFNTSTSTANDLKGAGVYYWMDGKWNSGSGAPAIDPGIITPEPSGNYSITGTTCFDVKMDNFTTECGLEASRTNSFSGGYVFTYNFVNKDGAVFSDLKFYAVGGGEILAGDMATSSPSGTLTFKSNVNGLVKGKKDADAVAIIIYATFKNNLNQKVQVSLPIKVKDCQCCGSNGIAIKKRIGNNDYLTHEYPTGTAGAMECWMVENSKEGTPSATSYPGHAAGERGYYYSWQQATATTNSPCPTGWKLPDRDRANKMLVYLNVNRTGPGSFWTQSNTFGGYRYESWEHWNLAGWFWISGINHMFGTNGTYFAPNYELYPTGYLYPVRCVQN